MVYTIRLNKQTKAIKVVNRKSNIRLQRTHIANLKLQHTGKTGPKGEQGQGLIGGGLRGQVLTKKSTADFDYGWLTPELVDKDYVKDFNASNTVQVAHNLNKLPAVSIIDSAGEEVEGSVSYVDKMNLIVSFSVPLSGRVTCN